MRLNRDLPVPRKAFREALETFLPDGSSGKESLRLAVTVETESVPLRELSDYLRLVDQLYGRMHPRGLRSYSKRKNTRIRVAEVNTGSLRLILEQAAGLANPGYFLMLWVLLRGLPGASRILTEAARNMSQAYEAYESGRLARSKRRELEEDAGAGRRERRRLSAHIRAQLQEDERLSKLPAERTTQIARFAAAVYSEDPDAIKRLSEFARSRVTSVEIATQG